MFFSAHFSICRPLNALLPAEHSHILSLAGTPPVLKPLVTMHLKEAYSAPQICRRFLVRAESKNDGAVSNDRLMFLSLNLYSYFPLVPSSATQAAKEGGSILHGACVYTDTHGCAYFITMCYVLHEWPG
jgi:hypothetical protein